MAGTLTVAEILTDLLDAFKTRLPSLNLFATDFSRDQVKYGQQVIAHLPIVPTAHAHVVADGYNKSAQNARDLLVDVPITIDGWNDVAIKFGHGDVVTDRSKNYVKTIANSGYVLAKGVVDYALSKVLAANFSQRTVAGLAATSKDTLNAVTIAMNAKNAGTPRYMLCSSAFFNKLEEDSRISSADYHGQRRGEDPFGKLVGVSGFSEIHEYPTFPATGNLQAFGFDTRAIGIATRLPMDSIDLARELGIPVGIKQEVVQDAETGLAIAGFGQFDNNTHELTLTSTIMFGAVAGSQGGAEGVKLDYAGHRIVTAE